MTTDRTPEPARSGHCLTRQCDRCTWPKCAHDCHARKQVDQ